MGRKHMQGRGAEAFARREEFRRDRQYQNDRIRSVSREAHGWAIHMVEGLSLWLAEARRAPRVGEEVRLYGKGLGFSVRGVVLMGDQSRKRQTVRYLSALEQDRAHALWVARREAEERRRYEETKAERAAQYAALPTVFQQRIDRFRANNPEFGPKFEGYELFSLTEAVKISALGSVEAIDEFRAKPYEEQRTALPSLDDGHSSNTFGAACFFARMLVGNTESVVGQHGALCSMVGCRDYGCIGRED